MPTDVLNNAEEISSATKDPILGALEGPLPSPAALPAPSPAQPAATPVPTPYPTSTPAPSPTPTQGPFSVDQVKAWAEGKQAPAPQEGPFTVDQVKAWAERGTGALETSPVLKAPEWWNVFDLVFPPLAGLENTNLGRQLEQSAIKSTGDILAGFPRLLAMPGTLLSTQDLQGKSLPELQAMRADLVSRATDLDQQFDAVSGTGKLGGEGATAISQGSALLHDQIKALDDYMASGGKVRETPDPLARALSQFAGTITSGTKAVAAGAGEVPVQFQESPVGQVTAAAGTFAPQLVASLFGSGAALSSIASQTVQAQHDEAVAKGADERTAALAGLVGLAGVPLQMVAAGAPAQTIAGPISRLLAGRTIKEGLADVGRVAISGLGGGTGMLGYQFMQNLAAQVSGYDPKRPLEQDLWQQFVAGALLDTATTGAGVIAGRLAREPAQVEVRTKPGALPVAAPVAEVPRAGVAAAEAAPPQTTQEIINEGAANLEAVLGKYRTAPGGEARAPAPPVAAGAETPEVAAGVVPPAAAPGAAAASRPGPLEEAQAAVAATQGKSPGEVLAAQGSPEAALRETLTTMPAAEAGIATAPRAAEAPLPVAGVEPAAPPQPLPPARETDLTNRLLDAYDALQARGRPESVSIAELQKQSGLPLETVGAWINQNRGALTLHEGDWSGASAEQQGAALSSGGRKHLAVDLSDMSAERQTREPVGLEGGALARLPGPREAGVISPAQALAEARGPLPQREAKAIVNRSAAGAGLEGKLLYVPTESALPTRIKTELAAQGYRPGSVQTAWDRTQRQLWVVGDAFSSAQELHRALIEDSIGRVFDQGRTPIAFVHDNNDPRLGWWNPTAERATLNTAQLVRRATPLTDASKTAVHESVIHAGLVQLFSNTAEGRAAYARALSLVRSRFDATGMSQELAVSRGFRDLEEMTAAYAREYGKTGEGLQEAVTEELLATYAEEHFPTRASLEAAPRWYQNALGQLGSELRRSFGWRVNDWDIQQLIRDSYAATRPGKTPLGIGAIPIGREAVLPDRHALSVLDTHPVTELADANVGQLELGHPLTEPQLEALYSRLEGAGHPVGIVSRPDGPIFVNYAEERLPNERFQDLIREAVDDVLGGAHTIEVARNEGTYASHDVDALRLDSQNRAIAGQGRVEPGVETAFRIGREPVPAAEGLGGAGGPPGELPRAEPDAAREAARGERFAAAAAGDASTGQPPGAEPRSTERPVYPTEPLYAAAAGAGPGREQGAAAGAREEAARVSAGGARAEQRVPELYAPRDTYERASIPGGGEPPSEEPRPDHERGGEPEPGLSARQQRINVAREATEAGLGPGEAIRQEAEAQRLGREPGATFAERQRAQTREGEAVYTMRPHEVARAEALTDYERLMGRDPLRALQYLRDNVDYSLQDKGNALLAQVTSEMRGRELALRRAGNFDEADRLEAQRLAISSELVKRGTIQGQALSARRLLYENGPTAQARLRQQIADQQSAKLQNNERVQAGYRELEAGRQRLVREAIATTEPLFRQLELGLGLEPSNEIRLERYYEAFARETADWVKQKGLGPKEQDALDAMMNRFKGTFKALLRERGSLPEGQPVRKFSATQRIGEALDNWPIMREAWESAVAKLRADNAGQPWVEGLTQLLERPFSEAQVRGLLREHGLDLRALAEAGLTNAREQIRPLAQMITEMSPLSPEDALTVSRELEDRITRLVQAQQQRMAEEVYRRATNLAEGAPLSRTDRGSLDRLIRLMNLGMLSREDWFNAIAPRFKLGAWDPETLRKVELLGEKLQDIQREAGPRELTDELARKIEAHLKSMEPQDWGQRRFKAIYMASMLSGPISHASYVVQNQLRGLIDLSILNAKGALTGKMNIGDLFQTYADWFRSIGPGITDLRYVTRTGLPQYRPGEERAGVFGHRLPGGELAIGREARGGPFNPINWYGGYKYVQQFLSGLESLQYRSFQTGLSRNIAIRAAQEHGLSHEDAARFAEQVALGIEEDRARALGQVADEIKQYGLRPRQALRRTDQLIQQFRLERAGAPNGPLAGEDISPELHRQVVRMLHRESPYGVLGKAAEFAREARRGSFAGTVIAPFVDLPANVLNEGLNWTPLGAWRGRSFDALQRLYEPSHQDWTKFSDREKSDLQTMFLAKGLLGTLGAIGGVAYVINQAKNPNPPLMINGSGPSDWHKRQAWLAAGHLPFTLEAGGRAFPYGTTPFKPMLATIGAVNDYLRYDEGEEHDILPTTLGISSAILHTVLHSLVDTPFTQGFSQIFTILGAPQAEQQRLLVSYLGNTLGTLTTAPIGGTGARQLYKLYDPKTYEARDLQSLALKNFPFANSYLLHPTLNIFGEPIDSNSIYRFPLVGTPSPTDPVYRLVIDNKLGVSVPRRSTFFPGTTTPLTPEQYYDLTKARGQALKGLVADNLGSEEFKALPQEEKQKIFTKLEEEALSQAKDVILDKYGEPQ